MAADPLTDPAASRVRRVVLDPRRVAYNLMAGARDERGAHLSDEEAFAIACERAPGLSEAFRAYRFTLAEVRAVGVALNRQDGPRRVVGPAAEISLPRQSRTYLVRREQHSREEVLTTTTASQEVITRAQAKRDADPRVSLSEAQLQVFQEDRDLYDRYLVEERMAVGGNGTTVAQRRAALSRGDTNSAAADTLGLKPRQTPAAKKGVTIEKLKPTSSGGETVPSALAIIEARTLEIMAATGCSQGDARDRAIAESPSLYAQYLQEFRQRADDTSD
jgi:hypothetical protein